MSRIAQILGLAFSLVCGSVFAQGEIRWAPDLATARRAASQWQVPMLIHFYGDNCLPCKTLEQRVLNQDTVVKTLNKYFICIRVNASQERATASEYQVHSWPTDVFVSPDGQVLYQGVCKQDITGYMEVLQNVAVSNRDRNTLLAADRAKQTVAQNQFAVTATQKSLPASSLPPLATQTSNTSFAASPSIAGSSPAAEFQVAPPTRPSMMESHAGLPPLAAHLASQPLGSNVIGTSNNVSSQMNAQTSMPRVSSDATHSQKQSVANSRATLVSNPYYPETEAITEEMVCTPDGKCGPATSRSAFETPQSTQQPNGHQPNAVESKPTHLVPNLTADGGPQFPPLPSNSIPAAPTFQPKTGKLFGNSTDFTPGTTELPETEPALGLIENSNQQATELAAYGGYCPISLVNSGLKVTGLTVNAVRHRGRTYLMESPEAVNEFMQAPDRYSPVLSGYDPMIFLETGKLVDGKLAYALHDPNSGTVILFSNAESQTKFKADPARNTQALGYILNTANKK